MASGFHQPLALRREPVQGHERGGGHRAGESRRVRPAPLDDRQRDGGGQIRRSRVPGSRLRPAHARGGRRRRVGNTHQKVNNILQLDISVSLNKGTFLMEQRIYSITKSGVDAILVLPML